MRLIVAKVTNFLILAVRTAAAGTSSCAAAALGRCNVCRSCPTRNLEMLGKFARVQCFNLGVTECLL